MNPIDLDRAIDEAARQLTAGEPAPDFRAAVIGRLVEGDRPRRNPLLAALAAAAALAGILVMVTVERPQRGVDLPARPIEGDDIALGRTPDEQTVATATTARGWTTERTARRVTRIPIDPSPVSALAPTRLAVEPLGIDTLVVTTLDPGPSTPLDSLQIAPLSIARMVPEGDQP